VLQRIGAPAAAALPDMLVLLGRLDPRDNCRISVILALGELVPVAPTQRAAVREAMFELLANERSDVVGRKLGAADFIDKCRAIARTEFGPETGTDQLVQQLSSDNPFVREFAAVLLADKQAADEAVIVALLRAIRGPHPDRFRLGELPQFEVFLDRRIQAASARAMLRIAPQDPRSVEAFTVLAERSLSEDRLSAVIAARLVGAAGGPMVPQLMRMAKDDEALIRREAITTLGVLGPTAAAAASLLEQLCTDSDPHIVERARAALAQVRK